MTQLFTGDLLESDADMIVQQCNCVTIKAHGLSEAIAKRFPYANLYSKRGGKSPNSANKESRAVAGSVVICAPDAEKQEKGPLVACLMAQITPGKPGAWCAQYGVDAQLDDSASRLQYFKSGLTALAAHVVEKQIKTVAFPFQIGCGLAGGKWSDYALLIDEFAQSLAPNVRVLIYKL